MMWFESYDDNDSRHPDLPPVPAVVREQETVTPAAETVTPTDTEGGRTKRSPSVSYYEHPIGLRRETWKLVGKKKIHTSEVAGEESRG